ncbi:MAG: hypothetical protein ACW99A_06055, partial [Candidatus Kariarchaeaceae archaeon]
MMVKEKRSSDYLFFRFPAHYALMLGPLIIGITNFFINTTFIDVTNDLSATETIRDKQYETIKLYLSITKIALVVASAFFITYRWTVINKDGSYGY